MGSRLEVNTIHNTMLRNNPKREEPLAYSLVPSPAVRLVELAGIEPATS
jgi:hypothetical protein